MQVADPTIPGLSPPNPVVVACLLLTLLFLPVAGLARTWDLRSYTGTMLARLSGRERAYSQRYTERFLARLAHAGAAECLTEVMAQWTWSRWTAKEWRQSSWHNSSSKDDRSSRSCVATNTKPNSRLSRSGHGSRGATTGVAR